MAEKNLISITLLFFLPYLLFLIQNSLFHNHDDDRKKEKKKLNEKTINKMKKKSIGNMFVTYTDQNKGKTEKKSGQEYF